MSYQAINWAFGLEHQTAPEKLILLHLCHRHRGAIPLEPVPYRHDDLQTHTGLKKETIARAIENLEKQGLIQRVYGSRYRRYLINLGAEGRRERQHGRPLGGIRGTGVCAEFDQDARQGGVK